MLNKAPNEYSIPTILGSSKEGKIRSAPAYTIIGRPKQPEPQVVKFPGPGAYDGRYEIILPKPPQFSMAERLSKNENDKKTVPGPASHFAEKVLPSLSFSFQIEKLTMRNLMTINASLTAL